MGSLPHLVLARIQTAPVPTHDRQQQRDDEDDGVFKEEGLVRLSVERVRVANVPYAPKSSNLLLPIVIVDVYTGEIDTSKVFDDPLDGPSYVGYQLTSTAIEFRVSDPIDGGGNSYEITRVLSDLLFGALDLANRFLVDTGESPIAVSQVDLGP